MRRIEPTFLPAPHRRPPHLDGGRKVSDNCCEPTLPF